MLGVYSRCLSLLEINCSCDTDSEEKEEEAAPFSPHNAPKASPPAKRRSLGKGKKKRKRRSSTASSIKAAAPPVKAANWATQGIEDEMEDDFDGAR